jgi:hypothetical protein
LAAASFRLRSFPFTKGGGGQSSNLMIESETERLLKPTLVFLVQNLQFESMYTNSSSERYTQKVNLGPKMFFVEYSSGALLFKLVCDVTDFKAYT